MESMFRFFNNGIETTKFAMLLNGRITIVACFQLTNNKHLKNAYAF
jgi:hypothetical protein